MTRQQQKILIIIAPILVVCMILLVYFMTMFFGKTIGYILSNIIYWIGFCIPSSIYITKGRKQEFVEMYTHKTLLSKNRLLAYNLLAFLPVFATCVVSFIPTIKVASATPIIIAFVYAIFNAPIEELFWRGLFNKTFDSIVFAYIYPTIMFSCWHIALALAKGIVYTGGSIALIGGSAFMGFLWGFVAYKTKSIKYTTIAHVITNIFAFSGLIYGNWFL